MPRAFSHIYYHFTWTTKYRASIINSRIESVTSDIVKKLVKEMWGELICLNSAWNHFHVLVRLPPSVSAAAFMNLAKGRSSRELKGILRWQEGYFVRSVSPGEIERVANYIRRQKIHHSCDRGPEGPRQGGPWGT